VIVPAGAARRAKEAAAIRAVYEQRGELSAAVELRWLFPGVTGTAQARACARTIAGWKPGLPSYDGSAAQRGVAMFTKCSPNGARVAGEFCA
jgi:hypothetical protein